MENRKIIAREVAPENTDFSFYFDGDSFCSSAGDRCYAVYIPGDRRNRGFNGEEYGEIQRDIDSILEYYNEGENTMKQAVEDTLYEDEAKSITRNTKKLHALKEWAKDADSGKTETVAEYLTIITGKQWETKSFRGYSQGDYCEAVYCKDVYSEESITEIGKMWLGCGSEFGIGEVDKNGDEDLCWGFFVIDHIRWQEGEELRGALAEMYGCDPGEMQVYLYDGETRTAKYKLMESA